MGRPPCCDKVGIKKGPWTPEEDIILVSYIQQHGPGNWRLVPTNTGLLRCSKSCRLRWTNYLRPGIKRGNFTPHEEGMIIHLQALLGNKWAAIASYLPQRTDNDIKNYWNTHLKKKMKKLQSGFDSTQLSSDLTTYRFLSTSSNERGIVESSSRKNDDVNLTENPNSTYASSAENISRLLQGWMKSSPKMSPQNKCLEGTNSSAAPSESHQCYRLRADEQEGNKVIPSDEFESFLNIKGSSSESSQKGSDISGSNDEEKVNFFEHEQKPKMENNPPFSFLENWLLDETANHEEVMGLPEIF